MTRWLVTGAAGMLGRDLVAVLATAGQPVTALTRSDLDVTDRAAVAAAVAEAAPHTVVNCAAWTAVDEAEVHEDEALLVNGQGAANVAGACASSGARLVQISTDYVFAGDAGRPYPEDAAARPHTAYGRSKLAGEQAVLAALPGAAYIVRTAWLFGAHGPNFVRTMIRLERERLVVPVVADQYGQPTGPATACSVTAPGQRPGYRSSATGVMGCGRRSPHLPRSLDRPPGPAQRGRRTGGHRPARLAT